MALFTPTRLVSMLALVAVSGLMSGLMVGCGSGGSSSDSAKASSTLAATSSAAASSSTALSGNIKLNQLGFLPESAKWAVVPGVAATSFKVINTATGAEVFSGSLGAATIWDAAEESVKLADFSSVKTPGDYLVRVEGVNDSYPFTIANDVYSAVTAASIKAFYFNRNSAELLPAHAGVFARPLGHPDTQVLVHPSAASAARPAGTVISAPKGWYDAGDYNKYIVNSGIVAFGDI